ncbi:MAG TPA: BTAD domain-containing putative transcriptional regulator [Streptosporangiaceae bacterium]
MTDDPGLRIGVLGPLLGTRDGAAITMPRGRAAVLLAVLALSPGRPIGSARLAELIWDDDDRPERARARLQTVVARLRGLLPAMVVTAGDGYLLDIDPGRVDLWRFRQLVQAASQPPAGAGPPSAAALDLLDEAVGLWRGEPLADLRSAALDRDVIPGLTEEYLSAVQQRAGLELAAGRAEPVTAELRGLTSRYPLREPLWELLMRALAQAGRPAEAIAEYHRARQLLSAELGVDPSPELQGLYQQLLLADQVTASRPAPGPAAAAPGGGLRRLPADTRVFTGRRPELTRLLALAGGADGAGAGGTVVISAIDGMAGIGKTALAVHVAHQLAARFPAGQLFIDLHGYTQGYPPRTANQALEVFLRTLGIPTQQIPGDVEERAALYRERLAGTRTLIVLDNAADEAQVRPLIPGSAGCLVLVTSRRKLQALDDAHTLALDVLPEPDAIALLSATAGPGRIAAGDPVAADLVGLCGRLPLTVRIAAALLRNRPTWSPAHLAGRLRAVHTRLAALSGATEDRDPAALFDLSSQQLGHDQQRLYRYLGLTPGPEVDAHAAAALLDRDPAAAERLLQDLVDHNLLLEPAAGRYRLHDLVRAHAHALAGQDPQREQQAALDRLLDYYQHAVAEADRAWLRAERANLAACVRYAIEHGLDERTVAFTAGVARLLRADGPWAQAIAAQEAGAAAAARRGDSPAEARALAELGTLRRLTGDYAGADRDLRAALARHQAAGDQLLQARVLAELGNLIRMSGDYPEAERALQAALELYRAAGDKVGQAYALTDLGVLGSMSGRFQEAERQLRAALDLCREAGDASAQPRALTELAELQRLTGDYDNAARNAETAVAISRQVGNRLTEANALLRLGRTLCMTGDYENAARHQEAALEIHRELGARLGQANALTLLAEVRSLNGDHDGAARDLEQAIATYRALDNHGNLANALNQYAAVVRVAGDLGRALSLYHEALDLAREAGQPDEEAPALEGIGEILLDRQELRDGAAYLGQARDIYQRLGMPAAGQITARLLENGPG